MKEENENDNKKIKIEIVKGNSKDLEISEVKDNLTFEVNENNPKKNGEIVIPENKNNNSEK